MAGIYDLRAACLFKYEAEISERDGQFVMAGHVAPEDDWVWFTSAWEERVMKGPPEIPFLHMTPLLEKHGEHIRYPPHARLLMFLSIR